MKIWQQYADNEHSPCWALQAWLFILSVCVLFVLLASLSWSLHKKANVTIRRFAKPRRCYRPMLYQVPRLLLVHKGSGCSSSPLYVFCAAANRDAPQQYLSCRFPLAPTRPPPAPSSTQSSSSHAPRCTVNRQTYICVSLT